MKALFLQNGIKQLAARVNGDERIYLGVRPQGFHAGNMLTMVVYPLLLCRALAERGVPVAFTFYVFINDWEQDALDGPDPLAYPFNVYPRRTTFQYAPSAEGSDETMADHWEPVIMSEMARIRREFPNVTITPVRNSAMKESQSMRQALIKTIREPEIVANTLREYAAYPLLETPIAYALAVCPECHYVRGETTVIAANQAEQKVRHHCAQCGVTTTAQYSDFDYWFYHKPLALPRIQEYAIDICITGLDHYGEGDYAVRRELMRLYNVTTPQPTTLYAPVLIGTDGRKMSKSKQNYCSRSFEELLALVEGSPDQAELEPLFS